MFEFHADRRRYFDMQVLNAEKHVIPFISKVFAIKPGMRVLEIGCGEGGVLKAFLAKGCTCVGVELDKARVDNAEDWLSDDIRQRKIHFIVKDIWRGCPAGSGRSLRHYYFKRCDRTYP